MEIAIEKLLQMESQQAKDCLFSDERSAIHSGKLGDIIYSLPTCRMLGVNHFIINVFMDASDPLRNMPCGAAKKLVPLLLHQPYLRRVSLAHSNIPLERAWNSISNVDYNLDAFRNIARHRVNHPLVGLDPQIERFILEPPVHLAQAFAAACGIRVDLETPWLVVPPSELTRNKIVVSITRNWRTLPNEYWKLLLKGLEEIVFVGHRLEWESFQFPGGQYYPAKDHLELASLIASAKFFLGTVSFPFSLAEALKIPRALELCHHQLNAFPVGKGGHVLPLNLLLARENLAEWLNLPKNCLYRRTTEKLKHSYTVGSLQTKIFFQTVLPLTTRKKWRLLRRLLRNAT